MPRRYLGCSGQNRVASEPGCEKIDAQISKGHFRGRVLSLSQRRKIRSPSARFVKPRFPVSEPGCRQQCADDAISGKIFSGELACLTAMTGIISSDCIDTSKRLFVGGVFEEAAADRIEFAKSRAHRHYWSTCGKVASAAIAEPAAVRSHINVLCDRELTARVGYKIPVTRHISRNRTGINQAPAAPLYRGTHVLIGRQHRHPKTSPRPVSW